MSILALLVTCPLAHSAFARATNSKPLLNTIAGTHKTEGANHLFVLLSSLVVLRKSNHPIKHVRGASRRRTVDPKEVGGEDRSLVDRRCLEFLLAFHLL